MSADDKSPVHFGLPVVVKSSRIHGVVSSTGDSVSVGQRRGGPDLNGRRLGVTP